MDSVSMKYERLAKKNSTIGKVIKECADYEEIGTVEEFKKLKEKSTPKKPIDNPLGSLYCECPNCSCSLLFEDNDFTKHNYCSECGQAIDWGDN